ncbi:MAG: ABC transporter ATP-binding protein [Pseudomonadota bacterium]
MSVPVLWTKRRVAQLTGVALIGAVQVLAALTAALAGSRLLTTPHGDNANLLLALGGATMVLIAARVLQRRWAEHFALSYIAELRSAFMSHVLRVPVGAREMRTGLVMTRVVNDLSAIKLWLADGLVAIVVGAGILSTVGLLAVWFQPALLAPLGLAVMVWSVPVAASLRPLERKVRESRRQRGRIAARAGQLLGARLSVLGLGRHGAAVRGLLRRSAKLNSALVSRATLSGVLRSSGDLVFPAVAFGLAGAAYFSTSTQMDAVQLGVLVMLSGIIAANLGAVALGLEYRLAHRVSLSRLEAVLQVPALELDNGQRLRRRPKQSAGLSVQDLPLAVGETHVSFALHPSETAVLSGLSDCESADLIFQLAGLKPIAGGVVRLGEQEGQCLRPRDWWRMITVVSPHLPMMVASVEANAKMGAHSSISEEEQARLFSAFGLTDHVLAQRVEATRPLPNPVAAGVRACRAILRRTPIILVDDPALLESEKLLDALIGEARARRVTLVMVGARELARRFGLRSIDFTFKA